MIIRSFGAINHTDLSIAVADNCCLVLPEPEMIRCQGTCSMDHTIGLAIYRIKLITSIDSSYRILFHGNCRCGITLAIIEIHLVIFVVEIYFKYKDCLI